MTRLLKNIALIVTVAVPSLAGVATVEAGCGGGGHFAGARHIATCPSTRPVVTTTRFQRVETAPVQVAPQIVQPVADRDFELLQVLRRNPELAARHRSLCVRLNAKFARFLPVTQLIPLAPAVVVNKAVVAPQPTATIQPTVVETPVATTPVATTPVATTPAAEVAPAAAPVAPPATTAVSPAPIDTPAPAVATPAAPPADLPPGLDAADPVAPVSTAPAGLPAGLPDAAATTISPELKPLVGLWRSVSTKADGSQEITEVNLKQNGVADVTIDSTINGKTSLTGTAAVQDGNLNLLQAGDKSVTLGKVLVAQADKVQLQRGNETLTLTRP